VLTLLVLLGCEFDTQEDRPQTWTVQEGGLQLQESVRVSEGEDFYFGRIADLAVADDGRMYVADVEARHVKVLSPDGTLQDTVGTRGDGPGEFRHPLKLSVARGDSLYVLDGADGRVHVFTPELAFGRGFLSGSDQGFPINMMIPDGTESSPDRAFFFVYSPGARAVVQDDAQMTVRTVRPGGTLGSTLFTTPPYRMTSKELGNGGKLFLNIPFTPYPTMPSGRRDACTTPTETA
jgi:sugar lactone lactonase YvrE